MKTGEHRKTSKDACAWMDTGEALLREDLGVTTEPECSGGFRGGVKGMDVHGEEQPPPEALAGGWPCQSRVRISRSSRFLLS